MADKVVTERPEFRKEFSSFSQFVDFCENTPTDLPNDRRESRKEDEHYQEFTGVKNFKEAVTLAREGWPEGFKKSKELSSSMFDHVSEMIERVDVNHDVEGHAIDISRYVDGEPECWLKFENVIQEAEAGNRLIKISFNCSVSSTVSRETIIARGATIVALIELLEYAGHRVELTLVFANGRMFDRQSNRPPIMSSFIRIKDFDQNVNLTQLSYALAHPSVLRALMFSFMEIAPEAVRVMVGVPDAGYGTPRDILDEDKGDIHICHGYGESPQWTNKESAEKWILEELKKQGVHIKKEKTK